ncbi:MAG: ATP-binding cassette domain-containing protein [Cyclobacteriaceae bacterium]|nr:ATP-binding cassette domain-containing protein [Cyclobacteriaceae bacterium]
MAKHFRLKEEGAKAPLTRDGLRRVWGVFNFLRPYLWTFISGLVALLMGAGTLMAFPWFAGKLVDVASGKSGFAISSIHGIALLLIGILAFQSVFSFVRVYTFAVVTERTLADIRRTLYQKIIWLPMAFFDRFRVGELMSRITSDVSILQDTFTVTLAELLRQLVVLISGVVVIFVVAPKLAAFMLLTFPVLVIAALVFGSFIRKMSRKTQDQLAAANVVVEETLQTVATVKSFTSESYEVIRYARSLAEVVTTGIRSSLYRGIFVSFIIFTMFGGIVAVIWYGAMLVQQGEMTVGVLISFVLYTTFIGGSIAGLGDIYSQLQRAVGASERVMEILNEPDERHEDVAPASLKGDIEYRNVSFAYPTRSEVTTLRNINLTIQSGEKVALVGPSGSGKSTLVSLLMRFYEPGEGSIRVAGMDSRSYPLTAYRRNIGIVPQEVILFGGTIRENIGYGRPGASEEEILEAARLANAMEFITQMPQGLDTVVGDRGVKLSGGQRQRVAIARAILKNPAILILDEATSSLDAGSEKLVQEALEHLMKDRTTVIIAHRLSTIRKADRILVVKSGEVAESGTHDELIRVENGIYRNLLAMQIEVYNT